MSRQRLYATDAFPNRTFTADELRELAKKPGMNVGQYVTRGYRIAGNLFADVGAVAPVKSDQPPPNDIRCSCPECQGRTWTISEITALPNYPGGVVNPMRIRRIGEAVGHPLAYSRNNGTAAGTWHKAAPTREPQPVAAPGRAWVFNSSEEAMNVLPVNGMRIPAAPDGEVRT
jgi:hypothetical protein